MIRFSFYYKRTHIVIYHGIYIIYFETYSVSLIKGKRFAIIIINYHRFYIHHYLRHFKNVKKMCILELIKDSFCITKKNYIYKETGESLRHMSPNSATRIFVFLFYFLIVNTHLLLLNDAKVPKYYGLNCVPQKC